MVRIVNLGRTGLYVAMRNGELTVLGGRSHWADADEARRAAARENMRVSDRVLCTVP
ncbi:hypothetical protein [Azospirillum halopraeferens]|uniref:hypothetical protein n=1 Tax=Azospirillum halopraeferens TaxID=34010 RepID=UPI0003F96DAD|nr:hypothetical protein [Azospirillum halopraeferens]